MTKHQFIHFKMEYFENEESKKEKLIMIHSPHHFGFYIKSTTQNYPQNVLFNTPYLRL
jgi:hypothetical protein